MKKGQWIIGCAAAAGPFWIACDGAPSEEGGTSGGSSATGGSEQIAGGAASGGVLVASGGAFPSGGASSTGGSLLQGGQSGGGASGGGGSGGASGGGVGGGSSGGDPGSGSAANAGGAATGGASGGDSSGGSESGGATGAGGASELTQQEIEEALARPKQEFRFHHVHINSQSPQDSVDFYVEHFEATDLALSTQTKAALSGSHWLLFDQFDAGPAPWELTSALFHLGFGVGSVPSDHDDLVAAGVESETEPFHTSERLCNGGAGTPNVAFLYGPDREVFEINVAAGPDLRHLHFISADPNAAGQWYVEHVGISSGTPNPSETVSTCNEIQISPIYGGNLDGIQIFWYPVEFAHGYYPALWANKDDFDPQRGRAIDHIALSVEDLDRAVTRLRAEGVTVEQFPRVADDAAFRSAFVAGPDRIEIEIVEGHVQ